MPDFKQNYFQRRTKHKGPRSNNRIVSAEVQVISSDGQNLGILNTQEAITIAKNEGLDLIEIAQNAKPPVCKIMDMGKYKYDAQKKANKAKKKQKKIELKEIKKKGISSIVDLKNHNLNYKIREHSLSKVPILLICGKKEVDSNSVTIRRLDSNKQENIELKKFITIHQALNKAPSL